MWQPMQLQSEFRFAYRRFTAPTRNQPAKTKLLAAQGIDTLIRRRYVADVVFAVGARLAHDEDA